MTYMNREHLIALADRCDAGAATLIHEAENAVEVLTNRANGNLTDPKQWAAEKQAAAVAARQYAAGLRAEAADLGPWGQQPTEERIRQAEKIATAAECGGILIDGSRLSEAAADALPGGGSGAYVGERKAIEEFQAAETAAVEGSGLFEHVAETINGVEQVPFWRLGHADPAQSAAAGDRPESIEAFMDRWADEATAAEMDGRGDEWFAGKVDDLMGPPAEPTPTGPAEYRNEHGNADQASDVTPPVDRADDSDGW